MSPEIRSRGSGIAMKIMDNYTGIPGRASYLHDPALKHVCAKATNVESGFMVKVSQWESMVTPEGVLIPAQP